jgi:hypothetical protein
VVRDSNSIQMPTPQDHVRGDNFGVGVCQWAAETMRIGQEKGSLTIQWTDNKVTKHVWEIPQSMSIENMQGTGPRDCDLLITYCMTRNSYVVS